MIKHLARFLVFNELPLEHIEDTHLCQAFAVLGMTLPDSTELRRLIAEGLAEDSENEEEEEAGGIS